jgi:hypothetical protein
LAEKQTSEKEKTEKKERDKRRRHGGTATRGRRARRRLAEQRKRAPKYTARTADKYELYELAVQSPDVDVDFLLETFQKEKGRKPKHFREDFCGTAAMCAEWVRRGADMSAEGFDLDPEPLAWGTRRHLEPLGADARRVVLHQRDVRERGDRPADVRVAQNFSYQILKQRAELLEYFRGACEDLVDDGMFVIDLYGGPESLEEMTEEREIEEGFTYVWDQHKFYPGTGEFECHIHFRFDDGSQLKRAFSYTWRTWYLTELRDLLYEAGFTRVDSYFEGDSEDDDGGDGEFEKDNVGSACPAWVAYLVSHK